MKYKLIIIALPRGDKDLIGKETQYSLANSFKEALDILKKADNKQQIVEQATIIRENTVI